MNPEYLNKMSDKELNDLASSFGAAFGKTVKKLDTEAKIEELKKYRERTATIRVLGVDLSISVKKRNDVDNFAYLLDKPDRTQEDIENAYKFLLGEVQYAELVLACTDEDGSIDYQALVYAFNAITANDDLKN